MGAAEFGIVEADLARDLAQRWVVELDGTGRDGAPFSHVLDDVADEARGAGAALVEVLLSFVSTRAPRTTATVAIAQEHAANILDDLDVTLPVDLRIYAGYADRPPVRMATLKADAGGRGEDGRLFVTGASKEAALIEQSELSVPYTPPRLEAAAMIAHLWALGDTTQVPANPEALVGSPVELEAVVDLWDAVHSVAESQGWRIYGPALDGGDGVELRRGPRRADPPVATLATGELGTVTAWAPSSDRGDFANEIVCVYEWTDDKGRDRQVIGRARDPLTATPGNTRRATYRFRASSTQAAATLTAHSMLARAVARASTQTLEAINAFWVRPDHVVTVPNPAGGPPLDVLVDRVTFTTAGVMQVTTRAVAGGWTLDDALAAYPTIADHRAAFPTIRDAAIGPII